MKTIIFLDLQNTYIYNISVLELRYRQILRETGGKNAGIFPIGRSWGVRPIGLRTQQSNKEAR
jgi:hypothetical protein